MQPDNTSIKKILIVATKFLGDLIITTPGLKALRQKFPQAEIVVLVRSEYEDVLRNNPDATRIVSFDFGIRKQKFFERLKYELSFWKKIRNEKFDVVISLQPGDRIAFLAWISGAKIRVAPRKQAFWFLFNRQVNVYEDTISYLDYYNKIISVLTNEPVNFKTEFYISDECNNWADESLKSNNVSPNNKLIGIHPGASEPTKIWPRENYSELILKILDEKKTKVMLIAGPNEEDIVKSIAEKVNNENLITYFSNDVNFTAALIKKCKLFISNDTGTRHLSVAVKTPVIALMPEDNQQCWNFYDESDNHFVITGKRCFPEREQPYLGEISVEDVFHKINEIKKN
jgi:heptosyltransferase-2